LPVSQFPAPLFEHEEQEEVHDPQPPAELGPVPAAQVVQVVLEVCELYVHCVQLDGQLMQV
jgi:hypothetical protein